MSKVFKVHAGNYWSDGGALMGVLPYAIWKDKIKTDERRRQKMDLNLLLIVSGSAAHTGRHRTGKQIGPQAT